MYKKRKTPFVFDQADFDHWATLAKLDPDAFEVRRSEVIERYLQEVPAERRQRLRCLQWRIDQIRRTAKTPLASCIRISEMMWDMALGENGLLENLNRLNNPQAHPMAPPRRSAEIIPLRLS